MASSQLLLCTADSSKCINDDTLCIDAQHANAIIDFLPSNLRATLGKRSIQVEAMDDRHEKYVLTLTSDRNGLRLRAPWDFIKSHNEFNGGKIEIYGIAVEKGIAFRFTSS